MAWPANGADRGAQGDLRRRRHGHDERSLSHAPGRTGEVGRCSRNRSWTRPRGASCASNSPSAFSIIPTPTTTRTPYVATPEKRALGPQGGGGDAGAAEERRRTRFLMSGTVLPLAKNTPAIALIGPLADSPIDMLGSWPAAGEPKDAVTLRAALQARCDAAKTKLLYAKGTEILTDSDAGFADAIAAAQQADVVVLALGESAREDDRRIVLAHSARSARQPGAAAGDDHASSASRPCSCSSMDGRWRSSGRRHMCPRFWRRGIPASRPDRRWPIFSSATRIRAAN